MTHKRLMHSTLGMLLVAMAVSAQPRTVKPGFNLFSKDQDVQLGREAASQIERQVDVVNDGQLQDYVERIGRRLVQSGEADKYPYTFKVVNDKSINAFALPGGPTYVHTGLILAAENEAQLAGVMAHEIAHVALRHGTNQASKANLIQLPAMLAGAVVGGNGGILGSLAQLGIGLGANSVLLKFSRNAERDADILGTRMMAKAGYNPLEMARFFEKLEAQSGKGSALGQFLSSHPNPGNRVREVEKEIQYLPRGNYNASEGDLRRIQQIVGGLPAPRAPRGQQQGAIGGAGGPAPRFEISNRMRTYQGRAFSIVYPDNWETFGDQGSNMLTIAPRNGLVQAGNGGVAVGLGVMVSAFSPQNNSRVDLNRDTQALVRQLAQQNPGMRVDTRSQRTQVDGRNALTLRLSSTSPFANEREYVYLLTVDMTEALLYAAFVAPESANAQARPVFEEMMRSVRLQQ